LRRNDGCCPGNRYGILRSLVSVNFLSGQNYYLDVRMVYVCDNNMNCALKESAVVRQMRQRDVAMQLLVALQKVSIAQNEQFAFVVLSTANRPQLAGLGCCCSVIVGVVGTTYRDARQDGLVLTGDRGANRIRFRQVLPPQVRLERASPTPRRRKHGSPGTGRRCLALRVVVRRAPDLFPYLRNYDKAPHRTYAS
jgi:hypothetical protein